MKRSEQLPAGYMRYTRFHSFIHSNQQIVIIICDVVDKRDDGDHKVYTILYSMTFFSNMSHGGKYVTWFVIWGTDRSLFSY